MSVLDSVQPQKVLVVDDESVNRTLLTDILKSDYTVILAKSGEQALTKARAHVPDVILLDIVMPGEDGYDVLRQLKSDPATQLIPVIFITALDSDDEEEKGLRLGASDYISKPFRQSLVKARVDIHMRMVRQRKLLESLVNLDGLTNVPNRRCFDEHLRNEWSRAERARLPLSLAMIDVDHFKAYNDHYGHAGGDNVLRLLASAMQSQMRRPGDHVYRYGGEEFVVLLPNSERQGAIRLLGALSSQVASLGIPHVASPTNPVVTISIGGVTLVPQAGMDA
ncbi:MAG: diguanylate cyclase, partial [Gammaproteobacteria bacterium]|nr:diguanylate cyclase [Gammaproteobacteria bacterium]